MRLVTLQLDAILAKAYSQPRRRWSFGVFSNLLMMSYELPFPRVRNNAMGAEETTAASTLSKCHTNCLRC